MAVILALFIVGCTSENPLDPCDRDFKKCNYDCGEGAFGSLCKDACAIKHKQCQEDRNTVSNDYPIPSSVPSQRIERTYVPTPTPSGCAYNNPPCSSGLKCTNNQCKIPNGQFCSNPSECEGGYCNNNVCASVPCQQNECSQNQVECPGVELEKRCVKDPNGCFVWRENTCRTGCEIWGSYCFACENCCQVTQAGNLNTQYWYNNGRQVEGRVCYDGCVEMEGCREHSEMRGLETKELISGQEMQTEATSPKGCQYHNPDCLNGETCMGNECKKIDGQICTNKTECANGNCNNGICQSQLCQNECETGQKECINETSKRECVTNNANCHVWSDATTCRTDCDNWGTYCPHGGNSCFGYWYGEGNQKMEGKMCYDGCSSGDCISHVETRPTN